MEQVIGAALVIIGGCIVGASLPSNKQGFIGLLAFLAVLLGTTMLDF